MIQIIKEKIPQSVDIEKSLLGSILIEKEAIYQVEDIICESCFFDQKNKEIYKSILSLRNKDQIIDLHLVQQELKNNNRLDFVTSFYLAELTQYTCGSFNIIELKRTRKNWNTQTCLQVPIKSQDDF